MSEPDCLILVDLTLVLTSLHEFACMCARALQSLVDPIRGKMRKGNPVKWGYFSDSDLYKGSKMCQLST